MNEETAYIVPPLDVIERFILADHWEQQDMALEIRNAFRLLQPSAAPELLTRFISLYKADLDKTLSDTIINLIVHMMQIRPELCTDLPAELVKRQIFAPSILYYGADATTRTKLTMDAEAALSKLLHMFPDLVAYPIQWMDQSLSNTVRLRLKQLMNTAEWLFLDRVLRILSWIGDKPVQHWFQQLRTSIPNWSSLFYLSIDDYISEGGWELPSDNQRRTLYFSQAYQLISSEDTDSPVSDAVSGVYSLEEWCRLCGRPLTVLLDLNLRHPALSFFHIDGDRIRFAMCEGCFINNHLFMEIEFDGGVRWSPLNQQKVSACTTELDMLFTPHDRRIVLGPACHSPFEVITSGDEWDASQLGGVPGWVQNAEYIICPTCQRRMMFIGQVVPCVVTDKAIDGVFYSFLCLPCRLSVVTYQGT